MVLAAFIFPVALMFLVTGGLYIWGIKGSYSSEVHIIELNEPLAKDEGKLQSLIEDELRELSVEPPSGEKKIKAGGHPSRQSGADPKQMLFLSLQPMCCLQNSQSRKPPGIKSLFNYTKPRAAICSKHTLRCLHCRCLRSCQPDSCSPCRCPNTESRLLFLRWLVSLRFLLWLFPARESVYEVAL